jgi:hypothetical protein
VAALIARLAFIAELARRLSSTVTAATTLVAGLALVAELTRGLIGKGRARSAQNEQAGQKEYRSFALHRRAVLSPPKC